MEYPGRSRIVRIVRWVVIGILLWCIAPGTLLGEEGNKIQQVGTEPPAPFILTIQDGLLSLTAQQSSLKAIIEALGRQLNIEVVAEIGPEKSVTLEFERLSLEGAIQRFRRYAHVVYTTDTTQSRQ
jgi:hypothetical protein